MTNEYGFQSSDYHIKIPDCKRFWIEHRPEFYSDKISLFDRRNDIQGTRVEFAKQVLGKKSTNGWSYYKEHIRLFDTFFPTFMSSHYKSNQDRPAIGYYGRINRFEANNKFIEAALKINDIPVFTMGSIEIFEVKFHNKKNWTHIYNAKEFFSNITHYYYPRTSDFKDPLPHALVEAIQAGCRIISPLNKNRNFQDGLDDILPFAGIYDEEIDFNKFGNSYNGLLESNIWKTVLESFIEEDFQKKDHLIFKYKSLLDFAESI